jgi:hypothetical protein
VNSESQWSFAGAVPDGEPFNIEGINVWQYPWEDTSERVQVKDPHYHQDFTFRIYRVAAPAGTISFAAGEFSNCIWGFYVRKPLPS